MTDVVTTLPAYGTPIIDQFGNVNEIWWRFFLTILERTGGSQSVDLSEVKKVIQLISNRLSEFGAQFSAQAVPAPRVNSGEPPGLIPQTVPRSATEPPPVFSHGNQSDPSLHELVTQTFAGFMAPADKSKLDTISSGATSNSPDAYLLNRANHTGTQLASTISDFSPAALAVILAGLSTATNSSVLSTDSILVGLGKLQAQLNARAVLTPVSIPTTVTAQNTTSDLSVMSMAIPAGTLVVGSLLRVKAFIGISSGSLAGNLVFWMSNGAAKISSITIAMPVLAFSSIGATVEFYLTLRASNTMVVVGQYQDNGNTYSTPIVQTLSPVTFNAAIANTMTFGLNWSVANAANIANAHTGLFVQEK